MPDRPQFALRFISGKYQGGEFPLRTNREIIIGRSSDLDMVLVEDMVSRKHAKITTTDDIFIEDLGSTNGTFVNGEKITRARLTTGDRILVGTSIIKMVAVDPSINVNHSEAEARRRLEAGANRQMTVGKPMSGVIEEIPLPDLLQLLSTSRKSGVLTVTSIADGVGRIYLRTGQIYFAAINDDYSVNAKKAIFRMLTWTSGAFELAPGADLKVMEELTESTEALLMEGVRQLDEIRRLGTQLPDPGSALAVPTPVAGKLRDLSPEQLDVFQLVLDHGEVRAVLTHYDGNDVEAAEVLLDLMNREFVVVP